MPVLAIGAGIAAIGGVASSLIGAKASNNAAQLQYQASQNALGFQQQVFNQQQQIYNQQQQNYTNANNYIQSTLSPFITAGQGATSTLSALNNGNFSSFYNSPDYNFALAQGNRGVTNYENAQGMGLSGGALKDVASFNQGLATQQYGNYYNRLLQIAQLGSGTAGNAASGVGSLTGATNNTMSNMSSTFGNTASTIGNTIQAGGQAQASGVVGSANAITGGINSGIQNSILAAALGNNPSAYKNNNFGNSIFGGGSPTGYGTG